MMTPHSANRLVYAILEQGVEPDFMDVLTELGIEHWTRVSECTGSGRTGIRLGDPIWPGANVLFVLVLEDRQVQPLVERMHQVRSTFPVAPGMRFIVTEASMY